MQGDCMSLLISYFRYEGLSMWPCFQDGDLLELAPTDYEQIRIGDCVAYRSTEGRQTVHRIVGKRNGLITRGDALTAIDFEVVPATHIIGRVVARHRLGQEGYISGGIRGRLAGLFYRYAGRLDPKRSSRGGRLARIIRAASTRILSILRFRKVVRRMILSDGEKITVLEVQGRIIGRQDSLPSAWLVTWPWSIFIDAPRSSCQKEIWPIS
jgi:hypothetical protein